MAGEVAGFACLMLLFVAGCCLVELVTVVRRRRCICRGRVPAWSCPAAYRHRRR